MPTIEGADEAKTRRALKITSSESSNVSCQEGLGEKTGLKVRKRTNWSGHIKVDAIKVNRPVNFFSCKEE